MASKEIQDKIKHKLFEEWMPDKPGGLKGLVNMAADAALAVLGERVEFLEGELEAAMLESALAKYEPDTDLESESDSDDANASRLLADTIANLPAQEPEVDQTKYLCPQCAVTHQRDSAVGTRHAHLFYGGPAELVHLEHCPKLHNPDGICNCNAEMPSAAQRAQNRRDPRGS